MEYAISLTHYKQEQWVKRQKRNLCFLILNTAFFALLGIIIHLNNIEKQQIVINQNQQLQKIQQQSEALEQRIASLKSTLQQNNFNTLNKKTLDHFIDATIHLPLHGVIDNIQIYNEQEDKLEISGNIAEKDYTLLLNHFKQQHFNVELNHFQTQENNKTQFKLIITQAEK